MRNYNMQSGIYWQVEQSLYGASWSTWELKVQKLSDIDCCNSLCMCAEGELHMNQQKCAIHRSLKQ